MGAGRAEFSIPKFLSSNWRQDGTCSGKKLFACSFCAAWKDQDSCILTNLKEDRDLRKHREKRIIAEWQHQPEREEARGHTELLRVRLIDIYGADSRLGAALDSSLQVES